MHRLKKMVGLAPANDDHTARNVAMGVGAAAPFASLIGQKPMIHNIEQMHRFNTLKDLHGVARPGDVLLTSSGVFDYHNPKGIQEKLINFFGQFTDAKFPVTTATGTPAGYHGAIVTELGKGLKDSKFLEASPAHGIGEIPWSYLARKGDQDRVTLLRPKFNDAEMAEFLANAKYHRDTANRFGGIIDKAVGLESPELARSAMYDKGGGVKAGLKELLLPKLRSPEAIDASQAAHYEAMKHLTAGKQKDMLGKMRGAFEATADQGMPLKGKIYDRLAAMLGGKTYVGHHFANKASDTLGMGGDELMKLMPKGTQANCSSLPGLCMPRGKHVVPGVLAHDVLPSHFLRSDMFEAVGHYRPKHLTGLTAAEKIMAHGPTIARGAVGLGLAGGVYGANKIYHKIKGDDVAPVDKLRNYITDKTNNVVDRAAKVLPH